MNTADLRRKIVRVKEEIGIAEGELDEVIRAMDVSPGPEKVPISQVAGDAFEKLRAAKAALLALEELLASEG